jgi:hypothetical protein
MGIPVGLILIAAGAILAWGITDEPSGLDLDAIGVILMVIGLVGLVLTMLLWQSWWGPGYWSRSTYVEDASARPWYYGGPWARRTTTYVEDDAPPPPGAPPPPPP